MASRLFEAPQQCHRTLLLGVTPELAHMARPSGNRLLAIDQSPGMIQQLWQPNPPADALALCGDWQHVPLANASLDAVLGDGVLVFFAFPDGVRRLMREMRRLLHSEGRWLLRVFVRPEQAESVEQVHDDLQSGRIGSFHAYKWRLAMALQPSLAEGVRLADVWRAWQRHGPAPDALATRSGWPRAQIDTIEAYREAQATYYFPTLSELWQTLASDFELLDHDLPHYELGERCPLMSLRPLPA